MKETRHSNTNKEDQFLKKISHREAWNHGLKRAEVEIPRRVVYLIYFGVFMLILYIFLVAVKDFIPLKDILVPILKFIP